MAASTMAVVNELCRELASLFQQVRDSSSSMVGVTAGDEAGRRARTREREEVLSNLILALDTLVGPNTTDRALALAFAGGQTQSAQRGLGVRAFVSNETRRECWHVRGGSEAYVCLRGHCGCISFAGRLPSGNSSNTSFPLCKHLLAVAIAEAAGTSQRTQVSEEAFAGLVLNAS